jgi:hypothetical protein
MKAVLLALCLCVCASPAFAERLEWDFWPGETAATMVANHQYRANFDGSGTATAITPTCSDATQTCLSQPITFTPGDHVGTLAAFWTSVQLWSNPSAPFSFSIGDTLGPLLSVTSPTEGQVVTTSPITLQGTSSDPSGVASVTVNGTQAVGTTTWTRSEPLAVGANNFLVQARDTVGNISSLTRHVTYQPPPAPDTQPPTVAITSHTNGQVLTTSAATLQGTAGDNVGVTGVTVNGLAATGTSAWSRALTLAAGPNSFTVRAVDAAGNAVTQAITLTYQAPPPPPPPPPPSTCTLNGVSYALGAQVTQTMKNGDVDTWLSQRYTAGWTLVRRTKSKSQTTVTVKCGQ